MKSILLLLFALLASIQLAYAALPSTSSRPPSSARRTSRVHSSEQLASATPGMTSTKRRNMAARDNFSYGMKGGLTAGGQGALYIGQSGLEGAKYAATKAKEAAKNKQYGKMAVHGIGTVGRPVLGALGAVGSVFVGAGAAVGGSLAAAGNVAQMGIDACRRTRRKDDGNDPGRREARQKLNHDKAAEHTKKVNGYLDSAVDRQMRFGHYLKGKPVRGEQVFA